MVFYRVMRQMTTYNVHDVNVPKYFIQKCTHCFYTHNILYVYKRVHSTYILVSYSVWNIT